MQRNPELRGKPVAVCGSQEERHGIVLTASYPAKRFGVKTGMAIWQAKQACPNLIVVPPDYPEYVRISGMLREIVYPLPVEDLLYVGPVTSAKLRRVGVRRSGLVDVTNGVQLSLYADARKRKRWELIDGAMDELRRRYQDRTAVERRSAGVH